MLYNINTHNIYAMYVRYVILYCIIYDNKAYDIDKLPSITTITCQLSMIYLYHAIQGIICCTMFNILSYNINNVRAPAQLRCHHRLPSARGDGVCKSCYETYNFIILLYT